MPVHRLDRDTSGCLLLARNPKAHKRFGQAFEAGTVVKRYLAILDGDPTADSGEIDLPLIKVSTEETGWRMTGDPGGKPARTRWEVVERARGKAMLAFFPETGRTHQIRVHAAEGLGLPILGDPVYGKGGPAVMLHAAELTVPARRQARHPRRGAAAGALPQYGLRPWLSYPRRRSSRKSSSPPRGRAGRTSTRSPPRCSCASTSSRSGLPPYAYQQLKTLAGTKMTAAGELVITARKFRTQDANRSDARERVAELIDKALERQARRVKTKPSRAAKARRVDTKKGRSEVKAGRGRVRLD